MKKIALLLLALFATPALGAGPILWGGSNTARNLQSNLNTDRLAIAGTTGSGYIDYAEQVTNPATPATGHLRTFAYGGNAFGIFGENGLRALLDTAALTGNRTYSFPDTSGTFTLDGTGGFTQGSVAFAGASGLLAQDNANFFWNDTTNRLGLGLTNPREQLELTGNLRLAGASIIYLDANAFIHGDGGTGNFFAGYGTTYSDIAVNGSTAIGFNARGSSRSVVIGTSAGASLAGSGNQYHTFLGWSSGTNAETGGVNVTGGSDSICLGDACGFDSATPVNSVAIGASTIGRTNNQVTLGNYGHTAFTLGSDLYSAGNSIARTIRVGDAFGSDKSAGDVSIQGSRSTGSGTSGKILIKAAPSATTSSSLNTVQTLATFDPGTTTVGSTVTIKGQSTQTNPIAIVENNAGTDLWAVNATGAIAYGGATGSTGQILASAGATGVPTWFSYKNTTDDNTFLGDSAGAALASGGTENSFFGDEAGLAVTTGDWNTLIGSGAGKGITTGTDNTTVGYQACIGFAASAEMTCLGAGTSAGSGTPTGLVVIGKSATANDTGSVTVGASAKIYQGGVSVGYQAGTALSHAAGNSAYYNTLIGYRAGADLTSGSTNTVVGYASRAGTIALGNTIVGFDNGNNTLGLGAAITDGGLNIMVGNQVDLATNTTDLAVIVGGQGIAGQNDVVIGSEASSAGSNNVMIGEHVGFNLPTATGTTAVGYNAAQTLSTGNNNTLIGTAADVSTGTFTNSVALGASASAGASNMAQVGNSSVNVLALGGSLGLFYTTTTSTTSCTTACATEPSPLSSASGLCINGWRTDTKAPLTTGCADNTNVNKGCLCAGIK